jgi:hypothetical protein
VTKNPSVLARLSYPLTQSTGNSPAAKGREANTSTKQIHERNSVLIFNKLIFFHRRLPDDYELKPAIVSQQPANLSSQASGSENKTEILMIASQNSPLYS